MFTFGRKNWVEYLAEALWEQYGDGLTIVVNACRCGESFGRLAPELDRLVLRFQPDLVICHVKPGWDQDAAAPFAADMAAARGFVRRVRDEAGAEILFQTHNPVVWGYSEPRPADAPPGDAYVNDPGRGEAPAKLLAALGEELGIPVCDQYALWKAHRKTFAHPGANPQNLWMRMADTVHPGPTGHLAMFRGIAPYFDVPKYFSWEEVEA